MVRDNSTERGTFRIIEGLSESGQVIQQEMDPRVTYIFQFQIKTDNDTPAFGKPKSDS